MKISNELVGKVRETIFEELGIELKSTLQISENWVSVAEFSAPKSMVGIMAPMISSLNIEVSIGFREEFQWDDDGIKVTEPETAFVRYEYSYTHPSGGSNGYSCNKEIQL